MNVSRGTLIVHAVFTALLLWLYGGDLLDAYRIRSAEVSALTEPPNALFAGLVLLAALAALTVAAWGARTGRPADFKGYRLLPIVGVVALFVDVFLISADKIPVPASEQLGFALEEFRAAVEAKSSPKGVLTDEAQLRDELVRFGKPPMMVRGERPSAYRLQVRHGCTGPVTEAPGVEAGTVLYCISEDKKRAWLSAVFLPVGEKFGPPTVFRRGSEPLFGVVDVNPPEIPPEVLEQLRALDGGSPAPR